MHSQSVSFPAHVHSSDAMQSLVDVPFLPGKWRPTDFTNLNQVGVKERYPHMVSALAIHTFPNLLPQLVIRRPAYDTSPEGSAFDISAIRGMKHLSVRGRGGIRGNHLICSVTHSFSFHTPTPLYIPHHTPLQVLSLNSGFTRLTNIEELPPSVKTLVINCPGNAQSSYLELNSW